MSNQKTKINEQNYPVLREIYNIQNLSIKDLKDFKHLSFLTIKHANTQAFIDRTREGLTAIINYSLDFKVDYLVRKLFEKLDTDDKFRDKCLQQAALIPANIEGCLLLPRVKNAANSVSIVYNTVSADQTENKRKQLYVWVLVDNKIDAFEMVEIDAENKIYADPKFCIYSLKSADRLSMSYYMVAYLIFKHYATIETVAMQKGKARKSTTILNNESFEVENRMLIPVNIIDSSWFRTIKGDGFTVSGHLRFQYYASTKTHKWISIDPYEKSGYTRKAKGEDY